ncbi:hypothetical protein OPV22_014552 [Ensete ventricosum]|uniref:Protein kinase domain-containing protein n=1 Tax=Ensete ventricosum TaxID=4639 RepID=A0AAV8R6B2_ENSVE|nr:hypothetical protein OPV22_014552 [Ensete ventricosum]
MLARDSSMRGRGHDLPLSLSQPVRSCPTKAWLASIRGCSCRGSSAAASFGTWRGPCEAHFASSCPLSTIIKGSFVRQVAFAPSSSDLMEERKCSVLSLILLEEYTPFLLKVARPTLVAGMSLFLPPLHATKASSVLVSSSMGTKKGRAVLPWVVFFWTLGSASAFLSPKGVNFEVQALMDIKASLKDPHGVLGNWDRDSVDPCSWSMVSCSSENLVIGLETPSQNLSGTLSPSIGNLTNLEFVLLQNNNISGSIPPEIGKLSKLHKLDLSSNHFHGEIPASLGHLKGLQYLRLNNNSLSGAFPRALASIIELTFLDLSFNNFSGPIPRFSARTFSIVGNPLICPTGSEQECFNTVPVPVPVSFSINNTQGVPIAGRPKSHKVIAFVSCLGCICAVSLAFGLFLWWRERHNQQILFNVNDQQNEGLCLGNLKRFHFRELQIATNNFSSKNILGKGGFGNVYKGKLQDGTLVAVKRLKDGNAAGGEIQFQTEVEMISLAVHRNLLKLWGYCMTATERLLVYPYMSNGSVASRLKAKPMLDWTNQKGAMLDWVREVPREKLDMIVDKDLKKSYDQGEFDEMVQVALLCTRYLPGDRPKMSEVVRMLEADGLAERGEVSHRVAARKIEVSEFSSERYSDLTDDSSLLIQAMELSGPR